ncbi:hypothetical protein C5750_01145 [Phyllobacterium myrsinacearum]|uniref:Uncharacterized protein n=1 Tax=Phyllobacterium myrsinacearum TaxID=28101 RepID=A0A2S9JWU6_9HYPH|nr:hypothetical protein C5750_01145 [Phyllobacterium myrsinacearum]
MAFPFEVQIWSVFRVVCKDSPKNMKRSHGHPEPDEMTAPFRVASKGVYADGGSITERDAMCKFVA